MENFKFLQLIKHLCASLIFLFLFQPQAVKAQEQFANGADIGWLSEMEDRGYIFKNDSGITKNCMEILKEKGINALRFRVWVNPSNKYCSKQDVAYMSHRADSMGFKIMINFHLSDWWADPGHQNKPAAWATHTITELNTDVYNHVYDVLDTLKSLGVTPKWVQIGNETNDGMLWEDGRASTHMNNFAGMIKSGYNAVKAIDTTIQVIVQLSNGHDNEMFRWMFQGLKDNGAKWDIIGMSVYPYWAGLPWAEDNNLAMLTMQDMITRYNTKVMVCEAGYLYNQPVEANHYLLDLIEKTKSIGGLGVFYWEPESYNWQGYQLGAWDPVTKEPTVALDAFLGIYVTSVSQEENVISDFELYQNYPNPFNPVTNIKYELRHQSHIKLIVYNSIGEEVNILVDGVKNAGEHLTEWNGRDSDNHILPSGVYLIRFITDENTSTKKAVLLK